MDTIAARDRLQGCYTTIPTMFRDDADLSVDHEAIRRHVRFLIDGGLTTGNAVLLAGGAAGDFSTMTFDERLSVWAPPSPRRTAASRSPWAARRSSTLELVRLVKAAASMGADYVQVSPPFYHAHTEGDFLEHITAAADAADIGLIVYNTYWTSLGLSSALVEQLADMPNVVSLKWATPDTAMMTFEGDRVPLRQAVRDHRQPDALRDEPHPRRALDRAPRRQLLAAVGGALWQKLERGEYAEAQRDMVKVGDAVHGALGRDRGLHGRRRLPRQAVHGAGRAASSRNRPPDPRRPAAFREKARQMLVATGVPGVIEA